MDHKKEEELFAGRIRDLEKQARQNDYLTHTGFLSLSEQSAALRVLDGLPGARAVFCGGVGGSDISDRKVLFFLPSYMEEEDLLRSELSGEGVIACLRIRNRGAGFTKEIGHRDCLGALMHLGIGREQVGDILIGDGGDSAYVFLLSVMAEHVCRELAAVGRAHVDVEPVPPAQCGARPKLVPKTGSVASVRIDSLVSMVFPMPRSAAKQLVEDEQVYSDGRTIASPSWTPPEGARISVRGHGKFIYEGREKTTRKGRILVRTSVFS